MRFKRMSEIYLRLVDHTITSTNKINDFSVGSAIRSIYESVSIELEQFYILTRENIQEAIERGVYESFGFTRKPPIRAFGTVQITFHNRTQQDTILSRGSRFISNQAGYSQTYETLVDYRIPKGSLVVDVEVFCTVSGTVGNVPEGVINVINSPIANVKSIVNNQAIQTGQDEEPLEELRARFRSYIETLSRATIPALEYGTREVDEVSGVYIHEEVGRVIIYAHDRNGNLTNNVKSKIEENLHYYRPAGIPIIVKPVTRKDVDIEMTVTLSNKSAITDRFKKEIEMVITGYLNNMQTSKSLILSDLSRVVMNLDKQLIYDVEIENLEGNIILQGSEIIKAGSVSVKLI